MNCLPYSNKSIPECISIMQNVHKELIPWYFYSYYVISFAETFFWGDEVLKTYIIVFQKLTSHRLWNPPLLFLQTHSRYWCNPKKLSFFPHCDIHNWYSFLFCLQQETDDASFSSNGMKKENICHSINIPFKKDKYLLSFPPPFGTGGNQ